jgi:hypothetical protein
VAQAQEETHLRPARQQGQAAQHLVALHLPEAHLPAPQRREPNLPGLLHLQVLRGPLLQQRRHPQPSQP